MRRAAIVLALMMAALPGWARAEESGGVTGRALKTAPVLASLGGMTGTARSVERPASPLPSAATVSAFGAGLLGRILVRVSKGYTLAGQESIELCVGARQRLVRGMRKTVSHEYGCAGWGDKGVAYRFDGIAWEAIAEATVPTLVETMIYARDEGRWLLRSRRETGSSTRVDLAWRGYGDPTLHPQASVGMNYALPPFGPVSASVSLHIGRAATVTGSMRFAGLRTTVVLDERRGSLETWN